MTAEDRTVQVPVSLIETAARNLDREGYHGTANRLWDLLSQPTPTAEQSMRQRSDDPPAGYWMNPDAEPPRPEDMAPGTTFSASRHGLADLEEFKIAPSGRILYRDWRLTSWHRTDHNLNPSTIRDVTPPAGT